MKIRKAISVLAAASLAASLASVASFAADGYFDTSLITLNILDSDGVALGDSAGNAYGTVAANSSGSTISLDGLSPNQTFYIPLGIIGSDTANTLSDGSTALASDLVDTDLFKLSLDKDGTGKSLIKSITQVSEKSMSGNSGRGSYLKIVLNDTTTTDELKATAEITFKAKNDMTSTTDGFNGNTWDSGESLVLNLTMWINNQEVSGSDGSVDTGTGAYYSPTSNEDNTLIWGDDRAALEFSTDDDASDFYVKLSTKTDSEIYTEYGDPVGADLWFYTFVGSPTVPTTSRATLTLGIPWDTDDDIVPNPEDCYIYEINSDGTLTDITDSFAFSEDTYEIDGWTIKTRTLGSYVISDSELDVYGDTADEPADSETSDTTTEEPDKTIPNTGSSDMVNVAVVAGVISLAGAAAVAFKRAN